MSALGITVACGGKGEKLVFEDKDQARTDGSEGIPDSALETS